MHKISLKHLSIDTIKEIIKKDKKLALSADAKKAIQKCRTYLENKLDNSDDLFYGINTGLGSLCNVEISKEQIEELQVNLVRSHACGVGAEIPHEIVQLMLLLKIQSLSYGHSGVRLELVDRLIAFYNNKVYPVIYELGSLGASGDLAPLAHLSLPLFGEGEVFFQGKRMSGKNALKKLGLKPLVLKAKEGLALLNGTQFMNAYGVHLILDARELLRKLNKISALSLDVFNCRLTPFEPNIHTVRHQSGQGAVAKEISKILKGSGLQKQAKKQVQDPYSFRCIPQVHGATLDAINHVEKVMENEANSVTDNPLIFPDEDKILSGGNFHGQPLALALDYLALSIAELGSISERRLYKLVSGHRDFPPYLVENPGLNSGLMIAQYTAASIVSLNKQLCTPASVDTIPSSAGQEDHVSMGANAATKALKVLHNVEQLAAIEWLAATQALEFKRPLKTSKTLESSIAAYRNVVPYLKEDAYLAPLIEKSVDFLRA